ncbi:unnamed protein product [Microthlaspi erraticum]|uniref:Uncharacterized protein n=1 Tax=Microthlaspi erraticum TaxID=1685480 RepID=A0A6D2L3I4_9BRAS|nr:unnamed protein product [Microthlaspi erraticum]CAA7060181.1 unnamed protein product [Microthlaspi erraticum]
MGISLRRRCFSNAILASPSTLRLYLSAEGHNKIVEVLLENRAAVRGVYSIAAMYSIQGACKEEGRKYVTVDELLRVINYSKRQCFSTRFCKGRAFEQISTFILSAAP